jgi:outer membrane receptor protein involved in Fe transport
VADQRCDAAGVPDNYKDGDTQQRTRIGGNPDLKPETATTFTVGAVVQPRVLKGFSFTVDYYRIDVKQAITTIGTDIILNSCYLADAPQYCDLVQRDPSSGKIVNIIDTMTNVGGDATAGMDFGARYDFGTPIGRFGINADLNWLHYFNREFAGGTVVEAKDTYDLSGVYPAVKAIAGVRWGYKGVGAGFSGRFVSAFKECENNTCADVLDEETQKMVPARSRTVSAYAAFDAFLNYDLKTDYGTTNFLFGVNNVFDQSPPAIYNDGFNNSDPGTYDFMGRYFYLRIGHTL